MSQQVISPEGVESIGIATSAVKQFSSEYDLQWHMLSADYAQFHLVGTNDAIAVAGYETRYGQTVCGISIGDSRAAVRSKYGAPLKIMTKNNRNMRLYVGEHDHDATNGTYYINHQYVTFFYDVHKHFEVRAVLSVDEETEMAKTDFSPASSPILRDSYEDLTAELINAVRAAEGLHPLLYSPEHNTIARSHSMDMIAHAYFGHVDSRGLRGAARMKNGGMTFSWWGENLAFGQYSAIHAHEALMNSMSHRENILREQFTHLYVGVAFTSQHQPYFTMNFYT